MSTLPCKAMAHSSKSGPWPAKSDRIWCHRTRVRIFCGGKRTQPLACYSPHAMNQSLQFWLVDCFTGAKLELDSANNFKLRSCHWRPANAPEMTWSGRPCADDDVGPFRVKELRCTRCCEDEDFVNLRSQKLSAGCEVAVRKRNQETFLFRSRAARYATIGVNIIITDDMWAINQCDGIGCWHSAGHGLD